MEYGVEARVYEIIVHKPLMMEAYSMYVLSSSTHVPGYISMDIYLLLQYICVYWKGMQPNQRSGPERQNPSLLLTVRENETQRTSPSSRTSVFPDKLLEHLPNPRLTRTRTTTTTTRTTLQRTWKENK